MKASGIITVVGSVGALVLIGLALLLQPGEPESMTQPPGSTAGSPSVPATPEGSAVRPALTPPAAQASASGRATGPQAATSVPSANAQAQPPAPPSGTEGPSAFTGSEVDSRFEEVLGTARRAPTEEERLSALRWLAERAGPQQFDALQEIQINDPSPEVRKAAEAAVNALRERHAHSEWPGVPQGGDPQGYMRDVPSPR